MTDMIRDLEETLRIVRSAGLDVRHVQVMDGLMSLSVPMGREYLVDLRTCEAMAVTNYEKLDKVTLRAMLETVEILERACSKAW